MVEESMIYLMEELKYEKFRSIIESKLEDLYAIIFNSETKPITVCRDEDNFITTNPFNQYRHKMSESILNSLFMNLNNIKNIRNLDKNHKKIKYDVIDIRDGHMYEYSFFNGYNNVNVSFYPIGIKYYNIVISARNIILGFKVHIHHIDRLSILADEVGYSQRVVQNYNGQIIIPKIMEV
jgi:hypothetical protein